MPMTSATGCTEPSDGPPCPPRATSSAASKPHHRADRGDEVVAAAGDEQAGELGADGRDQRGEDDARAHRAQPSEAPPRRDN